MKVANSSRSSASIVGTSPSITRPVPPSIVIHSPSFTVTPPAVNRRCRSSTSTREAPHTHGLPMPRHTTAAWLVRPPVLVRMPFAASMP